MLIDDFNNAIDTWINAINKLDFQQLCFQPDDSSWSIGQICVHLLNDTSWFLEQVKICLSNNDNANETMISFAKKMFDVNSFPNEKLANPANANMAQPINKEALMQSFINLKKEINHIAIQIENTTSKGKTQHPGFGYFNATEWLQFATMHLNHHLKQKERIENFVH